MRAGIQTFEKLHRLIQQESGIFAVRNLGTKSEKEIRETFLAECYARLLPYEKAIFWQDILDASNESDNN